MNGFIVRRVSHKVRICEKMAKEIAEEYASSLADLRMNSKPLINMLTILAEENIVHADVIVDTVEKHLEKVQADIKLPVLYLVDSIIKNVGGAYIQKFSQSIVSMFTKTFKLVDEKTRSQMFKLRETWHEVFPSTKMYQLDVKVSLIDPAWPIQAQPQQSSIHFNPSFLKMPSATPSTVAPVTSLPPISEEEKMRLALARKEQELLTLQRKKIEMELEQTKKQLELAQKTVLKGPNVGPVTSRILPMEGVPMVTVPAEQNPAVSVKQRLGPPVNKNPPGARITPVSGAMLSTVRRDPRLARHVPPAVVQSQPPQAVVAPTLDPKLLDFNSKTYKRKNVITIDVAADVVDLPPPREPRTRRDPRLDRPKRDFDDRPRRSELRDKSKRSLDSYKKNEDAPYKTRKSHHDKSKTNKAFDDFEESKKPEEKPLKHAEKIHDKEETNNVAPNSPKTKKPVEEVLPRFLIADAKMINKLPPIPKLSKQDDTKSPNSKKSDTYKKKSSTRSHKRSTKSRGSGKESSDSSSPEKKPSSKESNRFAKSKDLEQVVEVQADEQVSFKELKNYHKEKYMRRNKEKSESPDRSAADKVSVPDSAPSTDAKAPEVVENMDVDLRLLPPAIPETTNTAAPIGHKRHSTEVLESKNAKKHKFDVLFGNEDVDLRQLPQVDDLSNVTVSTDDFATSDTTIQAVPSPNVSPKREDWHNHKEKCSPESSKKAPSHLDLVRAKLAEATKGKDRLGRQLLFNNSLDDKEHSQISDVDLRMNTNTNDLDSKNDKESIKIIISQAKEQYKEGNMNEEQYRTLIYQVMQLNERLKLKEAKQRESLEESKRKLLKANISDEEMEMGSFIKKGNNFGDIDERVVPTAFIPAEPFIDSKLPMLQHNDVGVPIAQDSDLRHDMGPAMINNRAPLAPPPMFMGPLNPRWRAPRPREEFNGPRGPRSRPFFHGKFDNRGVRNFEPRMPLPPPPPSLGMFQGDSPFLPYEHVETPPYIGLSGASIPPTDMRLLEYIDRDPMKTIEIDGVPREIRFYGETAVVMLNWDDPREIKFLPGSRRITFDNKDSIVLGFNEDYTTAEVDDQVFKIRFGAPTRELYVNGRWYECYFGGPPCGIVIEGVPRMIQLEGPPPQVTICTEKRTDLVAGKINMIVDAKHMCPVFLDAKPQKCSINNVFFTLRFVDSLKTVLINEVPFRVEFGGMPRPLRIGNRKHFIRFSMAPNYVKPGQIQIADMEGKTSVPCGNMSPNEQPAIEPSERSMEIDNNEEPPQYPEKSLSPEAENSNPGGLDILSSVMPTSLAPASQFSGYSLGFAADKIPGLDTPVDEAPPTAPSIPLLGNINVNDLFAKLVASGIVPTTKPNQKDDKEEANTEKPTEESKQGPNDNNKNNIKVVDLLKPQSLRVKQPGIVSRLYGGMQCSGCGARFPPERTVRYSQHLDWHFRQNRRERDSARRAHSRHWHYDLSDWVQYEEIEDLEEREKSWFETAGAEGNTEASPEVTDAEAPSVPAGAPQEQYCTLCGDKFDQFYNEDKEEWHLRKAVRHDEQNYHPLCFEDYKASQMKAEAADSTNESLTEQPSVVIIEKDEAPIEINDCDDDHSQTDNESVVEVLEDDVPKMADPVEIEEEGDEDDVVLKAEPVEEVVVDDDADTDDETQAERAERDKLADIDFAKIKIKQEPVDPDDEPVITAEEEAVRATVDTTSTTVLSSIDGNVQLDSRNITNPALSTNGIRINITKLPTVVTRPAPEDISAEDLSADEEPLPPGEEPELDFTFKPTLEGVRLSRQPPVTRGMEVSGLCSIM